MPDTKKTMTGNEIKALQAEINFPSYEIEVNIKNRSWNKLAPDAENICKKACAAALDILGVHSHISLAEVSIMLAGDKELKELNNKFLNKNKPTNVLSFPAQKFLPGEINSFHSSKRLTLGDIALSLETIKKEAKEQKKTLREHLSHMVIHATLHLLGYDHEKKGEAEIMEALEIRTLSNLGIANPYSGQ